MATLADLSPVGKQFSDGYDTIVIKPGVFLDVTSGRTLNFTGYANTFIRRGHPIILETATGDYKPMPLNAGGTAYGELPADHKYMGLANQTVTPDMPFVGIVRGANVNPNCNAPELGVYALQPLAEAIKTEIPTLDFYTDI